MVLATYIKGVRPGEGAHIQREGSAIQVIRDEDGVLLGEICKEDIELGYEFSVAGDSLVKRPTLQGPPLNESPAAKELRRRSAFFIL